MSAEPWASLGDEQAVGVLALVLDHDRRLPDPLRVQELDAHLAQALTEGTVVDADTGIPIQFPGVEPGEVGGAGAVSAGALARDTLAYLAATRPGTVAVIERAIALQQQGTAVGSRIEPLTVGLGALVVLALQTEVLVQRGATGKWTFKVHKRAMSDSALGRLLARLIAAYTTPN
ncbi:MAG TPA: hypothetical protein VFP72_19645 [Kineosporiaceae bacterium]|nr:hypothetical protein [Kineosporiaceae bacterium]